MVNKMMRLVVPFLTFLITMTGCKHGTGKKSGEIIIFHAGSLSVPFKEIADEFMKLHPSVKVLLEPAGSLVCARKITELKKPCDIIASADYFVINKLLIPGYTSWSIRFATNEIVLAFQEKSRYSTEIDSSNWADIILREDVSFSRSDPDSDPCGYRTVMTFRLAEKYYSRPGLADKLLAKDRDFIRPKEVDLVALVESNAVDYMFQYRSVAIQHNLKYIELPSKINLGDPSKDNFYNSVDVEVTGNTPGSKITVKGEYINYSLSILKDAADYQNAVNFLTLLLGPKGQSIFRKYGQQPIIPFSTEEPDLIPPQLRSLLKSEKAD